LAWQQRATKSGLENGTGKWWKMFIVAVAGNVME
jgi:hypothetical protein